MTALDAVGASSGHLTSPSDVGRVVSGRSSAQHRKVAIWGWLGFTVLHAFHLPREKDRACGEPDGPLFARRKWPGFQPALVAGGSQKRRRRDYPRGTGRAAKLVASWMRE